MKLNLVLIYPISERSVAQLSQAKGIPAHRANLNAMFSSTSARSCIFTFFNPLHAYTLTSVRVRGPKDIA